MRLKPVVEESRREIAGMWLTALQPKALVPTIVPILDGQDKLATLHKAPSRHSAIYAGVIKGSISYVADD